MSAPAPPGSRDAPGGDSPSRPLEELLGIMRRLRDPAHGCPWDIAQTFRTIAPYTIEEAYEVLDAIERDDREDLRDELGDLLLQVVFHARMAEEEGAFDFDDVARAIVDKMTRRHPHVFGSAPEGTRDAARADTRGGPDEEIGSEAGGGTGDDGRPRDGAVRLDAWEAEKARERAARAARLAASGNAPPSGRTPPSALDGIASSLPALLRADKLQRRAARVGFDWSDAAPVRAKLEEEIAEVDEALASGEADALEDEIGDLLFTAVNLARHHGIDPEGALRRGNAKFERRFRRVEVLANEEGAALDALDPAALDALWERAKR